MGKVYQENLTIILTNLVRILWVHTVLYICIYTYRPANAGSYAQSSLFSSAFKVQDFEDVGCPIFEI